MPLGVRISASDWISASWSPENSLTVAQLMVEWGADFIDVSGGGLSLEQDVPGGPGCQMPFAAAVRQRVSIPVGTVGLITSALQAEQVLADGVADGETVFAQPALRSAGRRRARCRHFMAGPVRARTSSDVSKIVSRKDRRFHGIKDRYGIDLLPSCKSLRSTFY
jgi:2,4-dienoyl-CoA reductase-like NADH-dependent reductase (Old Yellow Enzyme family)